jgi:sugar phosphate isomerase/epimerase
MKMRRFWGSIAAVVTLGVVGVVAVHPVIAGNAVPTQNAVGSDYRTNGFLIGCQSWSFNHYTVMEAIEKAAQTGGKTIEFYPGQPLSPDKHDIGFGPGVSDEVIAAVKAQMDKFGLKPVAFGVIGLSKDENQSRQVFDFAKKLGIGVINSEFSPDAMDTVEKLVKEYDIKVGIHNHPKRPNDPSYRNWDPNYVLALVKERDKRIGSCADMGHFVRSGIRPTDAMHILKGRIISSHLKDLNEFSPGAHDVPYGTGISDIPAILREFRKQKFEGPISVEYEYDWETSVPEIAQCIGFVRGFGG